MPVRRLDTALPDRLDNPYDDLAQLILSMSPEQLEGFTAGREPHDIALIEQIVAEHTAEGWRVDPTTMAAHLDATYRRPRYIQILGDAYRRAVQEKGKRIIISLPARYGKSKICSQWGPAWTLDGHPDSRSILVSYGDELAMENALGCRDILDDHRDVLRGQIRPDARRKDRFLTTAGGGILARGLYSAIRGFGVTEDGVLVCDDLFKGWEEAHSPAARQKKWDTYRSNVRDRLDTEDAGIIHVAQRVHREDVIGQLITDMDQGGEDWELIVIPALAVVDNDILGRMIGEVIDPARFPIEAVRTRHRALGPYLVAAQEQQDPRADEGTELRRDWFIIAEAAEQPSSPDAAITSWDLKLKNKEAGDFVVGQAWWRVGDGYWLMDSVRGQFDHATTANAIALLSVRNPIIHQHVIETAGSYDDVVPQLRKPINDYEVTDEMAVRLAMNEAERAAVQAMRRTGLQNIVGHAPQGDKTVRARTYIAPKAEPGQVRFPIGRPWIPALLDELAAFGTKGVHDDQVDAMSQALQRLDRGQFTVTEPKAEARPPARPGQQRSAGPQLPRGSRPGAARQPRRPGPPGR